jgi:hypothetical protein
VDNKNMFKPKPKNRPVFSLVWENFSHAVTSGFDPLLSDTAHLFICFLNNERKISRTLNRHEFYYGWGCLTGIDLNHKQAMSH